MISHDLATPVKLRKEIVWLMADLGIAAEDFAQALSDLLTQDARLEAGVPAHDHAVICCRLLSLSLYGRHV